MTHETERREIMELSHEPWAGFRTAFAVVFAAACIYLAALLLATLPARSGPAPHDATTERSR